MCELGHSDASGVSKRICGHYALAHRISSLIEDDLIDMLTYLQAVLSSLETMDGFSWFRQEINNTNCYSARDHLACISYVRTLCLTVMNNDLPTHSQVLYCANFPCIVQP